MWHLQNSTDGKSWKVGKVPWYGTHEVRRPWIVALGMGDQYSVSSQLYSSIFDFVPLYDTYA